MAGSWRRSRASGGSCGWDSGCCWQPPLWLCSPDCWFGISTALLKYNCLNCTRRFCCFLLAWIIRALLIGLLWPISVMIDGDWYACCYGETKVDCGKPISVEDQNIIKDLKIKSRIYGFGVLLGIILVAAILRCVPWMKFCTCRSNWVNKNVLFHKIVLEEGENLVTKKLIEAAKEKINEKLDMYVSAGEWLKCYDVVDEIIAQAPSHELLPECSCNDGVVEERTDEPLPVELLCVSSSTVEITQKPNRYVDVEESCESSDVLKEIIDHFPYYGSVSESSLNEATTSV